MQYLSPIVILGENFRSTLDPKLLQRERKRLLAELELEATGTLDLFGRSFTKDQLISFFDNLQQDNIPGYHLAIAEDPILLRFLHDAEIEPGATFNDAPIYADPSFLNWISPFFRTAFTTAAAGCIDRSDARAMHTILGNKLLMTDEEKDKAWLVVAGIFDRNIALFEHYKTRTQDYSPTMMPVAKIATFVTHAYIETIRQLPDSRFARLKDNYAFHIQYPAIAVFNRDRRNRPLAFVWMASALELAVSPHIKAGIRSKTEELELYRKKNRKKRLQNVLMAIGAFLFLFFLFDLAYGGAYYISRIFHFIYH